MAWVWKFVTGVLVTIHGIALLAITVFLLYVINNYVLNSWSGWHDFKESIQDWSTLITGILAVGAAYLTVREMRRIEENDKIRHQQNIGIANRRDEWAIRRMRDFLPTKLRAEAAQMVPFVELDRDQVVTDAPWSQSTRKAYAAAVFAAKRIGDSFNDRRFKECSHLFTTELEDDANACASWARLVTTQVPIEGLAFAGDLNEKNEGLVGADHGLVWAVIMDTASRARNLATEIEEWAEWWLGSKT